MQYTRALMTLIITALPNTCLIDSEAALLKMYDMESLVSAIRTSILILANNTGALIRVNVS